MDEAIIAIAAAVSRNVGVDGRIMLGCLVACWLRGRKWSEVK
jgi:hypothetical protein